MGFEILFGSQEGKRGKLKQVGEISHGFHLWGRKKKKKKKKKIVLIILMSVCLVVYFKHMAII